jgi:transglutaminase-like putative cysteine protease
MSTIKHGHRPWEITRSAPTLGTVQIALGCRFQFALEERTSAVVLVEPHSSNGEAVFDARWEPEPSKRYVDIYGNVCRRLLLATGSQSFEYNATVEVANRPEERPGESHVVAAAGDLPASLLHWLLPSRYCESDALAEQAWIMFGETPADATRVQAICDWIHETIAYGVPSLPTTTASDALAQRGGMCRDFAHLGVTFCRALGIPARYVSGYIPDIGVSGPQPPQDFHAWFEAFLGGRWWTFDARFNVPRIGRIPIARGRDAADVAMVTTFRPALLEQMTVWADVLDAGCRFKTS